MNGAEDLLRELELEQPTLVRLAEAVSLAIRVDPPLLRRMRLTLVPEADAGTEADLWRSVLVKSRSPEGFVFYVEIAEALRERLAKSGRLADCWKEMETLHLHLSPALRLEEEIAALSVSEEPEAETRIEKLLQSALAALVVEDRKGLVTWAARALPALPAKIRKVLEARMLAMGAELRLRGDLRSIQADEELSGWLPWLAPKDLPRVHVGVRLFQNVVELDARTGSAGQELLLPQADPLEVGLSWVDPESREWRGAEVTLRRGEIERIAVSVQKVQLRTMLGEVYNLRPSVRKVFLSSTARDLGPCREAVFRAISRLDGFQCVRMEDFDARYKEADPFCRGLVAECDVFVGLVGYLYGSVPPGGAVSFTEGEYEAAMAAGIPRLLFLASESFPLGPTLREPEDLWQRQQLFRDRVKKERVVDFFDAPDPLAMTVTAALGNLEREGNHVSREESASTGSVLNWGSDDSAAVPSQEVQLRTVRLRRQDTASREAASKRSTLRRVFLGSAARDLGPCREAVFRTVAGLDGFQCVRMEDFGARDKAADPFCRGLVAECDVFVGLVGYLYGSVPPGGVVSFTEGEYEAAVEAGIPRLLFLASDSFPLGPTLREPDDLWQRQQLFRDRVKKERVVGFFEAPDPLATAVTAALRNLERAKKAPRRSGRPAQDLRAVTAAYLKFLEDRHRYLDFKGMGVSDRVPLRLPLLEMYVPLKARVETPSGETWERLRVAGRRPTEEEAAALGQRVSGPQALLDLLAANDGLVVLGDPGAGKSTFLKFLTLCLATGRAEKLGLAGRLPVLLPLAAYANALAAGEVRLDRFLALYAEERVGASLGPLLEQALVRGTALLLLDGLDEVREPALRNAVVERVRDCFSAHRAAGNKFVLTSRIVGYREVRPAAEGLAECMLVDFEDEEIAAFVEKWTAAIERAAGGNAAQAGIEATRERRELLEAVARNPGVRSLAANPLLLTILAVMKRQGVTLPERRAELYQTYVETLLWGWNLVRSLAGRSARDLDVVETLKVLAPLALWMHETSPGVGLVKEWDLHQELDRIYRERGSGDPEKATRRFLEDVREHAALLLDRGGRQYGFIHLIFQEYLAAVAQAQKGQQDIGSVVEALAAHVGDPAWHEVSLLTIGYLGIVQKRDEAASAVVVALLAQAPGPPGEAVLLAGQAVTDAGAAGVTPACRQVVVSALLETLRTDGVAPQRRAAAGTVLAELGDPRFDPERWFLPREPLLGFVEVPAGPFLMGEGKERHEVTLPAFFVGRFPVTVDQFRAFLEHSGFEADPRALEGVANEPVGTVSWHDAEAYCDWLTARLHELGGAFAELRVTLPSEAEWEKAVRGTDGREYPWGDKADPEKANCAETRIGGPSTVGCFPGGASPYGCEEMSGNVWEWTRSPGETEQPHDLSAFGTRVLRGGSFRLDALGVRCAVRFRGDPAARNGDIGFRVVLLPFSP